ncbi:proline--tRNA ligase [Chromatiales bacterium (ex Bugula neritina AB1)]|nr:proline--tRNA ligase [Chromatiales bacterium (ex Bugula neritina AB1)]
MNKKAKTAIQPTRSEDFPGWYQKVITAADLAENSKTRGCMIIKPYGYAIWENIQSAFDLKIKAHGVENAYFPLLIPLKFIASEAEHIDGFAKECAVVTHHKLEMDAEGKGLIPAGKLEEPYVIRPTSETVIGDAMSRWINSYRDLPMKLNQWCNVMRWEMRTRLFLRTSEFLWQEGHNAFATAEESDTDARLMADVYAKFAENVLAIPVITGEKTASERFPGAKSTYTIEAVMQDGKALQAGTSHNLGTNFAKSSGIVFQDKSGKEQFAHTTSWGISTRLIGGLIMVHSDDDGLQLPPAIAPYQVVIIPVIKDLDQADAINEYVEGIKNRLTAKSIRVQVNRKDDSMGNKIWDSIKKGVPIRVEIGVKEVESKTLTHVRRDIGRDSRASTSIDEFIDTAPAILDSIQNSLFERAKAIVSDNLADADNIDSLENMYTNDYQGLVRIPAELIDEEQYKKVARQFSLSERCLPFADNNNMVVIGRAY